METVNKSNDNKERMIREAMRKIVLGRSVDRIDMAPSGTSGIGTARMIHGYVAKYMMIQAMKNMTTTLELLTLVNFRMKLHLLSRSFIKEFFFQA